MEVTSPPVEALPWNGRAPSPNPSDTLPTAPNGARAVRVRVDTEPIRDRVGPESPPVAPPAAPRASPRRCRAPLCRARHRSLPSRNRARAMRRLGSQISDRRSENAHGCRWGPDFNAGGPSPPGSAARRAPGPRLPGGERTPGPGKGLCRMCSKEPAPAPVEGPGPGPARLAARPAPLRRGHIQAWPILAPRRLRPTPDASGGASRWTGVECLHPRRTSAVSGDVLWSHPSGGGPPLERGPRPRTPQTRPQCRATSFEPGSAAAAAPQPVCCSPVCSDASRRLFARREAPGARDRPMRRTGQGRARRDASPPKRTSDAASRQNAAVGARVASVRVAGARRRRRRHPRPRRRRAAVEPAV